MTITAKQFNKIALKEDLNRVENKIDKISDNVESLDKRITRVELKAGIKAR